METQTAPARRVPLADQVFEQLRRLIQRGDFPPGVRLPPEEELARRFGVSRPIVREAIGKLAADGVVESRRGSGTIVRAGLTTGPMRFPELRSIADVQQFYEFRIDVESRTAMLAAQRSKPADLAQISAAIEKSRESIEGGNLPLSADLNFAFHRAIATAAGNRFHQTAVEMLPNVVGHVGFEFRIGTSDEELERARVILSEHAEILEAITNRDPEKARQRMIDHITSAQRYVYENIEVDLSARRVGAVHQQAE